MHALVASLALIVPALVGLQEAEVAAVRKGDVPVRSETFEKANGKAAGRGMGAILIDRPVEAVWATLCHYEDKPEYQPRLKTVTILERQPNLLHIRMEVDASVTTARYTAWFRLDEEARTISWTIDRTAVDNTIADVDGEYRLFESEPGQTLLVYRTYVDAGRSVPKFIQDFMTRRSIPNLLRSIKKRVESGGTWRK